MDRRGVAGVHTDLPSLMIVIIAVSVFMVAAGNVVVIREDTAQINLLEEQTHDLLVRFMSCSITNSEGVVDTRLAGMMNNETLIVEFSDLDLVFNIVVTWDNSTFEWGSIGSYNNDVFAFQAPILVNNGELRPGTVSVRGWHE